MTESPRARYPAPYGEEGVVLKGPAGGLSPRHMARSGPEGIAADTWLADSGASSHMVRERRDFATYTEIAPIPIHSAELGASFDAVGRGTVCVDFECDGRRYAVTLSDVLHTPAIAANLLSIPKLDAAGIDVIFSKGVCTLLRNGTPFARGRREQSLYRLDLVIQQERALSVAHTVLRLMNTKDKSS